MSNPFLEVHHGKNDMSSFGIFIAALTWLCAANLATPEFEFSLRCCVGSKPLSCQQPGMLGLGAEIV